MNRDSVLIESYEVEASIGVFDWERKVRQRLVFDLELKGDFSAASISDDLADAVDYAAVCRVIDELIEVRHYKLLESLAEQIAQSLLKAFPVRDLVLRISKPGAIGRAARVAVQITRSRT